MLNHEEAVELSVFVTKCLSFCYTYIRKSHKYVLYQRRMVMLNFLDGSSLLEERKTRMRTGVTSTIYLLV